MHMQHFAYVSNNSSSCFAAPSNPAPFRPLYNLLYLHFFSFPAAASSSSSAPCVKFFFGATFAASARCHYQFLHISVCAASNLHLLPRPFRQNPHTHTHHTHLSVYVCFYLHFGKLENSFSVCVFLAIFFLFSFLYPFFLSTYCV